VGFLPSFADVPSAEIPPPTIPSDDKVDAMFTFMRENMVTKADLMQLQRQIEERTKSYVDSVVSAVTREFTLTTQTVVDLCNRVDKLEAADRRRTASVPPTMVGGAPETRLSSRSPSRRSPTASPPTSA
jgi:hypothetical protein